MLHLLSCVQRIKNSFYLCVYYALYKFSVIIIMMMMIIIIIIIIINHYYFRFLQLNYDPFVGGGGGGGGGGV